MTDPSTGPDEREHTLPSGLKVTIRSHRVLRRADIHAVWAAGNRADPGLEAAAQHDKLMELLVAATSDPQRYPVPLSPDVLDALGQGDAGCDYIALYRLMNDGYRLANGLSVVPKPDDFADPTRPKPESSGTSPGSAATERTSNPSPAATGTTSTTTTTSTAPASGTRTP